MTREQIEHIKEEIEEKEQKIRDLTQRLSSPVSSVGDWKVSKCMEYLTMGLETPYDLEQLHVERQAVRDEINVLQDEIEILEQQISGL